MSHRKWRETKQQLIWWPDLALLGCWLVSLHFICEILATFTVHIRATGKATKCTVWFVLLICCHDSNLASAMRCPVLWVQSTNIHKLYVKIFYQIVAKWDSCLITLFPHHLFPRYCLTLSGFLLQCRRHFSRSLFPSGSVHVTFLLLVEIDDCNGQARDQ